MNDTVGFSFPKVEKREFEKNYLDSVVIELRYPTLLRLVDGDPVDLQNVLRSRFPNYQPNTRFQMTPKGTTGEQSVYQFADRSKDTVLEITSSTISLQARRYTNFEDLIDPLQFVLENCVPLLDTNFFTRIGLRFINKIAGFAYNGSDIADWINSDLTKPIGVSGLGSIAHMHSNVTGSCGENSFYLFQYGLSPEQNANGRQFVLDWDYYCDDVDVKSCIKKLLWYREQHRDFFWWSLGKKAQEALNNGTARTK